MSVHFVLGLTLYPNVLNEPIPTLRPGTTPKARTPVKLEKMYLWLLLYPDKEKAEILIEGFSLGVKLPFFSGSGCHMVDNL